MEKHTRLKKTYANCRELASTLAKALQRVRGQLLQSEKDGLDHEALNEERSRLKTTYASCQQQASTLVRDMERVSVQLLESEKVADELADIIKRKGRGI